MKKPGYGVLFAVFFALAIALPTVQAAPPAVTVNQVFPPHIPPQRFTNDVPYYTYQVVNAWPHDPSAFTEGLVFHDGALYESTGLYGQSSLRKVELETGRVLQQFDLPEEYFGEGLALFGNKLFQLTWRNNVGFVYDLETFEKLREWRYEGEGWGLTSDGRSLIRSDGTHLVRFLDPMTFRITRTMRALGRGLPVINLNELEYVKGEIYANAFGGPAIFRIDPTTGKLLGVIFFDGLLQGQGHPPDLEYQFNGIAYDAENDRLFVTGKNWPTLFEVRIVPLDPASPRRRTSVEVSPARWRDSDERPAGPEPPEAAHV